MSFLTSHLIVKHAERLHGCAIHFVSSFCMCMIEHYQLDRHMNADGCRWVRHATSRHLLFTHQLHECHDGPLLLRTNYQCYTVIMLLRHNVKISSFFTNPTDKLHIMMQTTMSTVVRKDDGTTLPEGNLH